MSKTIEQPIDNSRRVDWSVAGCKDSLTSSPTVSATSKGAKGDGVTDDSAAIQAVIDSLKTSGGIIQFPGSTFYLKSGLTLYSNVLLKGSESPRTHLVFDSGNDDMHCIKVQGAQPKSFVSISKAPQKGDTSVEVSDVSGFKIGDYAEIREANGSWFNASESWATSSKSWAANVVGQFVKITAISGKTISFNNPIRIDYESSGIEIGVPDLVTGVGIKSMKITRQNNPNGKSKGANCNMIFKYAAQCWVSGVESEKSVAAHLEIDRSTNITVNGCFFHESYDYSGTHTQGYGVCLLNHTGECLIENNIFRVLRHAMMVKQGANGNVFACNFAFDGYRSEYPHNLAGDIQLHGHYAFSNLFESNVVDNIWVDHTWGPSGPYNTFFRNRARYYGIYYTDDTCGNIHNWVMNEVTHSLPYGFLRVKGHNHLIEANSQRGKTKYHVPFASYYYTEEPEFWKDTANVMAFGCIGERVQYDKGEIPAQSRYGNKKYTYLSATLVES